MSYLVGQIIWYLILTAVLWGAIGWWLRSVSHDSQVRALKADYDARMLSLARTRDELRDQLEKVAATRADGQLSASARTRVTEHVRALEKDNAKGRRQLQELGARLEALQSTSQTRDQEYEKLRQRLAQVTAKLREAEAAKASVNDTTRAQSESSSDLSDTIERQAREMQALRQQLGAVQARSTPGNQEHARLLTVIQAQKRTIEQLNQRPAPQGSTGDTGRLPALREVSALRAALRARDAELVAMREQLQTAQASGRAPSEPTADDLFTSPPDGLLSEPRGQADDLKRINGIGPVLEARLNDLGVFHFHQIAGFSNDDIGWIAAQMNAFPNRILRDRWVDQAADLASNPGR